MFSTLLFTYYYVYKLSPTKTAKRFLIICGDSSSSSRWVPSLPPSKTQHLLLLKCFVSASLAPACGEAILIIVCYDRRRLTDTFIIWLADLLILFIHVVFAKRACSNVVKNSGIKGILTC